MTSSPRCRRLLSMLIVGVLCVPAFGQTDEKPSGGDRDTQATKADPAKQKSLTKARARRKANRRGGVAPALRESVQTLTQEYEAFADDPESATLRQSSDYFQSGLPEGVTTDDILAAVTRPVDGDPGIDGYVRWQLLSGLPDDLPEDADQQLVTAYESSPVPVERPGLTQESKNELSQMISRGGATESSVTEDFEQILAEHRALNRPILAFRDELLSRCPEGLDTFGIALEDGYDRLLAGGRPEMDAHIRKLTDRVTSWAASAPPADVRRMAGLVDEFLDRRAIEYYDSVRTADDDNFWLQWVERELKTDTAATRDLQDALSEALRGDDARPKKTGRRNYGN